MDLRWGRQHHCLYLIIERLHKDASISAPSHNASKTDLDDMQRLRIRTTLGALLKFYDAQLTHEIEEKRTRVPFDHPDKTVRSFSRRYECRDIALRPWYDYRTLTKGVFELVTENFISTANTNIHTMIQDALMITSSSREALCCWEGVERIHDVGIKSQLSGNDTIRPSPTAYNWASPFP